jgi:hypothetical protein
MPICHVERALQHPTIGARVLEHADFVECTSESSIRMPLIPSLLSPAGWRQARSGVPSWDRGGRR